MYLIDTYQLTQAELNTIQDNAKHASLVERVKGAPKDASAAQMEAETARQARVAFFCERVMPTILTYIRAREDRNKFSVDTHGNVGLTVLKSLLNGRSIQIQFMYGSHSIAPAPVCVRTLSSAGISSVEPIEFNTSVQDIINLFEILMEERQLTAE